MYNGDEIREFYDTYGEKEWNRLASTAYDRLNYHLHMHFLKDYIGEGKNILDAGCGAGRFSIQMARSGSRVTLLDISQEQLRIAVEKLRGEKLLGSIDRIIIGDLRNLSLLEDSTFDTVVCYGAPLNYVLENREEAVKELVRVVKPGGSILLSVNSKWGVLRAQLGKQDFNFEDFFGRPEYWFINEVIETGDLPRHEKVDHPARHFFEAEELEKLMLEAGLEDIVLGGSPCVSSGFRKSLDLIEKNETAWDTIIDAEEKAYCKRTMVDNGEFILARGVKRV